MHNSSAIGDSTPVLDDTVSAKPLNLNTTRPNDLRYWLALLQAPGVGTTRFLHILEHAPDLPAMFASGDNAIADLKLPTPVRAYLQSPDWYAVDKIMAWADNQERHIISLSDPRYPPRLKEIADPPPVLFVRGNPTVYL